MSADKVRFKKMDISDPVTVTMPLHVWLAFMFQYTNSDWSCPAATNIAVEVQNQILDPIYVREQEAAMQENADQHAAAFQNMVSGVKTMTPMEWLSKLQQQDPPVEPDES